MRTKWLSGRRGAGSASPTTDGPPASAEERLSAFWQEAMSGDRVRHHLLRHPLVSLRAIALIRDLPRLDAALSDSPAGRVLRGHLSRRALVVAPMAATGACVLEVPAAPADYSAGPHRQTLRRKVRAAQRAGTVCRVVADLEEQRVLMALLDAALSSKTDARYRRLETDHSWLVGAGLCMVAEDPSGNPLVVAVSPHDGEWASLECFISYGETPQHSDARYLLTQALVEQLSQLGVRHLLDTVSPHAVRNGLRHFQRMLGFRITRVRVTHRPDPAAPAAAAHGIDVPRAVLGPGRGRPARAATPPLADHP
jgi:hypothetical protein